MSPCLRVDLVPRPPSPPVFDGPRGYRKLAEAEQEFQKTLEVSFAVDNSPYMRAHLAYAYERTGDRKRAEALEGEGPSRYVAPYHLALIAAGLDDTPRAGRWLDRAFRDRSGWMTFLPVEPEFEKVRQAPEIQRLLSLVGPQK